MNMKLSALAAIALCMAAAVPVTKHSPNDVRLTQGTWYPIKWTFGGSNALPKSIDTMKLTVKNGKYEFIEGPTHDIGHLVLRPQSTPKEMDIVGEKGPNAGRAIPCIYSLKDDQLTVCYGLTGQRPKVFSSPPKSMILLCVYGRRPLAKL